METTLAAQMLTNARVPTLPELNSKKQGKISGCSLSQLDSDGDGIYDDTDACPDTPAGAEVYKSGCKIEVEAEPTEESDTILGMESTLFMIVAGGGGLVLVTLVLFLILRSRGDDFRFRG